jgi:hypothetical protein
VPTRHLYGYTSPRHLHIRRLIGNCLARNIIVDDPSYPSEVVSRNAIGNLGMRLQINVSDGECIVYEGCTHLDDFQCKHGSCLESAV